MENTPIEKKIKKTEQPDYNKNYMREYMRKYNEKKREDCICEHCGVTYKLYRKYRHDQTKRHIKSLNKVKTLEIPLLEFERMKNEIIELKNKINTPHLQCPDIPEHKEPHQSTPIEELQNP